jgi:hypothetical protein
MSDGLKNRINNARSIALILVLMLSACASPKMASTQWQEQRARIGDKDIAHGVPAYEQKRVSYLRNGKETVTVSLGEPVVIDVAAKEEGWGFFQFPDIFRSSDGKSIVAKWHMAADAIASYGKGGSAYSVSRDGGRTWSKAQPEEIVGGGLILPNGERIAIHTPPAKNAAEVNVPDSIDFSFITPTSTSRGYTYYRMRDLPEELQGVYINRMRPGEKQWTAEHAVLNDPQLVRYSRLGLFPVVWWGDLQRTPDGSIVAGIYPTHIQDPSSGRVKASGITFYRSKDNGRTWDILSRLPYTPDLSRDPDGNNRLVFGWTEPAFEVLSNGTYITVLRTNGPMYTSRSVDQGKTWSHPEPFTQSGVLPRLLELENGFTVLASGRPGVQLRFSWDGNGQTWTDPFEMLPFSEEKGYISCGYNGLLATGSDKFLLIYSDFKHKNAAGEERKAIKVREVTIKRR